MTDEKAILQAARKAYQAGLYDTLDDDGKYPVALETITKQLKSEFDTMRKTCPACFYLLSGLSKGL